MGGQTIISDVLAQQISATLNVDYQDFQPVIVFLNGEYWGIHTIRDRIDERYIEYLHKIDKDSVEFLDFGNVAYNNLIEFIDNNSLEDNSNYEYVKTQIDINNYIDYTIAELFFNNYDWPANNMKLWRKIPDGKWRWVFYDIDAGFCDENHNMLLYATNNDSSIIGQNTPAATFLFRNLLLNELFKSEFINRFAEILNNDFDSDIMINKLNSIKKSYTHEMISHINRWDFPDSLNEWEKDIKNNLLSFLEKRPCVVRDHIMEFFELNTFDFDCNSKVSELVEPYQLILAPNPNNGYFCLSNEHSDIIDAKIVIYNINGKVIYEENSVNILKNERKYFNLSGFSDNVFILRIIFSNYSEQKKIIITN